MSPATIFELHAMNLAAALCTPTIGMRVRYTGDAANHSGEGYIVARREHADFGVDWTVVLDDGRRKHRFHLNRSYTGLYVCPMIWRELDNFSSGSVCMVLASNRYDEDDYYRDYGQYLAAQRIK